MTFHIFVFTLALAIGNINAERVAIAKHLMDDTGMSQCIIKGPEGSGFEYRMATKSGQCMTMCTGAKYVLHKELMPKLMQLDSSSNELNKCTCRMAGMQEVFLTHLHHQRQPCSKSLCWKSYLSLYNVGKDDDLRMEAGHTNNMESECLPCDSEESCGNSVHIKGIQISADDLEKIKSAADSGDMEAQKQLDVIKDIEMPSAAAEDSNIVATFDARSEEEMPAPSSMSGEEMDELPAPSGSSGDTYEQGEEEMDELVTPEKREADNQENMVEDEPALPKPEENPQPTAPAPALPKPRKSYLMHLYLGDKCVRSSRSGDMFQVSLGTKSCTRFKFNDEGDSGKSIGGHFIDQSSGRCLSYSFMKQMMAADIDECEDCLELERCGLKGYTVTAQDWFILKEEGTEYCVSAPTVMSQSGGGHCLTFEGREEIEVEP